MSQVIDPHELRKDDLESGHEGFEAAEAQICNAPLEAHGDTTLKHSEFDTAAAHQAEDGDGRIIVSWQKDDPENPFNWSKKTKWMITITTCFISILTGLPAGACGAGNSAMSQQFNISQTNFPWLYWATTSWNMGAALFPLLFVPLTEQTGRMPGYFVCLFRLAVSYVLFLIWLIPSFLAPNFATLVVTRFFGGGASSVSINFVRGTIIDIWTGDKERSIPMSIFGMTSIVGIALGPFIGGAIQRNLSWRAIYWIQLAFDDGMVIPFLFILRETRGDVILARRAQKMRKDGKNAWARSELQKASMFESLKISFKRPLKMLFTELVVASFTLWISFAWGILFLFQSSIPQTFGNNYGFSTFQTGMIQLAISVGAIIGTMANPIQDMISLRSARRNKERPGRPIPEARLYFAIPGSLLFTTGLFWYGWSSYSYVPWIVPTLGIGCVGLGMFSIYLAVVNYLSDSYEKYAASALSAASLGRNTFGAFLPLASQKMYEKLGYQWASSLLGFIGLFLSLAPVYILWKGPEIRCRSPFMYGSTFDEGEDEERRRSISERQESNVSKKKRDRENSGDSGIA